MKNLIPLLITAFSLLACQEPQTPAPDAQTGLSVTFALPDGKTAWTPQDQIAGYSLADGAVVSTFTLTTEGGSSSAVFKTSATVRSGEQYRFIYPASAAGRSLYKAAFARIPAEQSVDGTDGPLSFLQTSDIGATLHPVPLAACLSFSIDGDAAALRRITLESEDELPLSGGLQVVQGDRISVTADEMAGTSSSVALSGPFEAGKTYSFSVLPGKFPALALSFLDDEGRTAKLSLDGVDLRSGETVSLGALTPAFESPHDWVTLQRATKEGIKPLVLVFMGEGFVEARRDTYLEVCSAAAEHIFSVEPFKHFRDYFSVYVGWEAAAKPGVGSPWNLPVDKDANGNLSFRSLKEAGRDRIYDWIAKRCPEVLSGTTSLNNVGVFMLSDCGADDIGAVCDWDISDAKMGRFVALVAYAPDKVYSGQEPGLIPQTYGATGYGYYEGGEDGKRVTVSIAELESLGYTTPYGSTRVYLNDYKGTILHEGMGHGFTHLMDEYWIYYNPGYTFPGTGTWYPTLTTYYHTLSFPAGLNLAPSTTDNPWKNLTAMRDELIAKDRRYERMGAFQGGLVTNMFGIWRPERVSVMMDCRPYFSTWQRALAWQRIMRSSGEKPTCDVVNNIADLREYMEIDLEIEGIRDPVRDTEK